MKYVADKDRKAFAADLKEIYHAPNADRAAEIRDTVAEKWSEKYPNAMKSWTTNWGCHYTDFQVFIGCQDSDLYDQCDRIAQFHVPETEPAEKRVS